MAYRNKVFRPRPFITPMLLQIPTYAEEKGRAVKTYDETIEIFGSFYTFGGTEQDVNGVHSVIDTATIETWYRPEIKSNCRIQLMDNGATYEIISEPENIEMRNMWLQFKVKRISGGA